MTTHEEREELLPCPFCGGSNVGVDRSSDADFDVTCWDCHAGAICCGPSSADAQTAIAAWNTRALSQEKSK
jgi:Lar family restriction alleviation protein